MSGSDFHRLCRIDELPAGKGRMFVVDETMLGLFNVDGEFLALANECPHAGASLAHGDIEGDIVACRIHHWRFSIRDGVYLDENKPSCNARTYPVRVVGDQVEVKLPAQP